MIVGHGDIAGVLPDKEDLLFFASGVSDSSCTDQREFGREHDLLAEQGEERRVVYFSTLSIYEKDTPYTDHKRDMEHWVREWFPKYCIIRIGNIAWGKNPNTFINYIYAKIKAGEPYEIRDEWKYILTKDEFLYWINLIPDFNTEMNIVGERMKAQLAIDLHRIHHLDTAKI